MQPIQQGKPTRPVGVTLVAPHRMVEVTAALAGAGGADRAEERPVLPLALAAKCLYDDFTTVRLARKVWRDNRALCAYCQVATLASFASAALALPEAARAYRALR